VFTRMRHFRHLMCTVGRNLRDVPAHITRRRIQRDH
jgi:hypothetical protein